MGRILRNIARNRLTVLKDICFRNFKPTEVAGGSWILEKGGVKRLRLACVGSRKVQIQVEKKLRGLAAARTNQENDDIWAQ
jgi:hypothetical protein